MQPNLPRVQGYVGQVSSLNNQGKGRGEALLASRRLYQSCACTATASGGVPELRPLASVSFWALERARLKHQTPRPTVAKTPLISL